ncbi:MAG: EAL domain-containing protein [Pseudomonadota bacterium]
MSNPIPAMRRGALGHLWAQIVLPISVVLILAAMLIGVWAQRITVGEATEAAERETVRLAESIGRLAKEKIVRGETAQLDTVFRSMRHDDVVQSIAVLDPHGLVLVGGQTVGEFGIPELEQQMFDESMLRRVTVKRCSDAGVVAYWPIPFHGGTIGAVRVERSLDDVLANARAVKAQNLAMMFFVASVLIAICLFIVKSSTRRLNRLTEVVHAVKEGDWNVRVAPSGYDEIGNLEQGFQTMLATVSSTMNEIEVLAYRDVVTGLPNRACFRRSLRTALAYGQGNIKGHVLFIDLDRFKAVNDVMGHSAGDRVLKDVADRLQRVVEDCEAPVAKLARLGGDEFTVLLSGSDNDVADRVAQAIIASFDAPFEVDAQAFSIGCSIGLCPFPQEGRNGDSIIRKADLAMYEAKQSGRGRTVRYHRGLADAVERRVNLQTELAEAIQAERLQVVYQPQVKSGGRDIFAVEALARWQRRSGEHVPPTEFIPLVEDMGLVGELGRFVRKQALRDVGALHAQGYHIGVAVNISALELFADTFAGDLSDLLSSTGFDPNFLELEITESTAIRSPDLLSDPITCLKGLGIRFAIDDFGVGYSSLSALSSLPFDTLKIDRSFVTNVGRRPDAQALLSAITAMARSLNLGTIAEGVEAREDAMMAELLGMTAMQGFYFGKPQPIEDLRALLRSQLSPNAEAPVAKAS